MLGDITQRRETIELRSRSEIEVCALMEKVSGQRGQQEQMLGDRR